MSDIDASKSNQILARARKCFPGNKWTRGPLSEPWAQAVEFPKILQRGDGGRVWDNEGREFIDFHCGFGASVLGYNDVRPDAAAAEALAEVGAPLLTGPTHFSVDLAERLVALRPSASWAMFAKNGTDVTTQARVIARAATGKRGVLRESVGGAGAYHGASPQWMMGRAGVQKEESGEFEAHYTYNDLASVERAVAALGGDVAAIFVGGASYPYSAPTQMPTHEFATGIRRIADACGALLVVDEIRTNFRVGSTVAGGSWIEAGGDGAAADLWCQCKALANGHPIAALVGSEASRDAAGRVSATGTYWLGAPPMAAALATLDALEADDCAALRDMRRRGEQLAAGLRVAAAAQGFTVTVSGPPAMPFLTFDDETPHNRPKSEQWCAAMASRGVWLHPHHNWYLCVAHSDKDIAETLTAAAGAFATVAGAANKRQRT